MDFLDLNNSIIIIVACLFLTVAFGLVFLALRNTLRANQKIKQRLAPDTVMKIGSIEGEDKSLLETLGNHITLPEADEIKRIQHQLAQAGFYKTSSVKIFLAAKMVCLLVPQLIIILSWSYLSTRLEAQVVLFIAVLLAVLGLFAPAWFLRWRQGRRTQKSKDGFPDMMDLMVASVEAGLGLDAALMRVTEELGSRYPSLKVNLDLMNVELRAGRSRHAAMVNFADRINLEEAKALAVILRQSEDMGSSLRSALRTFSEDMRSKRMLKAEEKAMALSAKLTVPLIVFIFPAIMVMLMLPAGVRLVAGLAAT